MLTVRFKVNCYVDVYIIENAARGLYSETFSDYCQQYGNPCRHGSTCEAREDASFYTCTCRNGLCGKHCAKRNPLLRNVSKVYTDVKYWYHFVALEFYRYICENIFKSPFRSGSRARVRALETLWSPGPPLL